MRTTAFAAISALLIGAGCIIACSSGSSPAPGADGGGGGGGGGGSKGWLALVGGNGTFAQSFDEAHWAQKRVTRADLFSVSCVTRSIGWAVGADGVVARTINEGASWAVESVPVQGTLRVVRFYGAVGVIAGDDGALAVTHDAGGHWTRSTATAASLRSGVVTADGSILVVGDARAALRSVDYGAHWSTIALPAAASNLRGAACDSAGRTCTLVDDAGHVWAGGQAGPFELVAAAAAPLFAVSMDGDASHAIAVGGAGTVLVKDGSSAWSAVPSGTSVTLRAALVADPEGRDLAAGDDGTLLASTDHGERWSAVHVGTTSPIYGLDNF